MALKLDLNLWMDRVFNLTPSPDLYASNANIVIATSATLGGIPQSLAASTSQIVVQSNASLENKKDLAAGNADISIGSTGVISVAKPFSVLTNILIASSGLLAVTKLLGATTGAISVNSSASIQVDKNFASQVDIRISTAGDLSVEAPAFDADAQAYITAVETADTQALEAGVKTAINDFVVGCKSDGIWNAIKASCILAGARTLTGALVPLVGTAPTNFNFVPANYNRRTGLIGDGVTKYLNSNRNNNAAPQNNFHMAAHVTTAHSGTTNSTYIGAGIGVPGVSHLGAAGSANILFTRVRSTASEDYGSITQTGFLGASRSSSASFDYRYGSTTAIANIASETPPNADLLIFARVVGSAYINGRIAFYSIGESVDLALLDARVTTLINAYGAI